MALSAGNPTGCHALAKAEKRLRESPIFHAPEPFSEGVGKFGSIWHNPMGLPGFGLVTFGEVTPSRSSGALMAAALTARQCRALVKALFGRGGPGETDENSGVLTLLPEDTLSGPPAVLARPSRHAKVNKRALEENCGLLGKLARAYGPRIKKGSPLMTFGCVWHFKEYPDLWYYLLH
jgi:hypothetical protein